MYHLSSKNSSFRLNNDKKFSLSPDDLHKLVADSDEGLSAAKFLGGPQAIAKELHVDLRYGRCDNELTDFTRSSTYGKNELPPAKMVSFLEMVWENLGDTMMQLLIICAVLSVLLGWIVSNKDTGKIDLFKGGNVSGWMEGVAILISVTIVTLVSSINNYQKELKFKELSESAPVSTITVIVKGHTSEIPQTELLVGDLFHVSAGMVIPCDAVLTNTLGLKIDESGATGESDEVSKTLEGDFILRSGSNVLEGEGLAMVTGVGINSFSGRIAMECRSETPETPMQVKLSELADTIGYLGMVAAVSMGVILSIKELINVFYFKSYPFHITKFLEIITVAITIVVVAVPEGLPLSVTIALAYSMKQMFLENNLVRHLVACETMGSATSICTDKTGTLTQNCMTVVQACIAGLEITLTGNEKSDSEVCLDFLKGNEKLETLVSESIALNSSVKHYGASGNVFATNKTEQALLKFLEKMNIDALVLHASHPASTIRTFPFSSAKKRMTTCVQCDDNTIRYYVKGASDLIFESCGSTLNSDGSVEPLTDDRRRKLINTMTEMGRGSLRTVSIAYVDVAMSKFPSDDVELPPDLCFIGVFGIEDPVRPEVEDSVTKCKEAGVCVRMVTGDGMETAISVATRVGIFGKVYSGPAKGKDGVAILGKDFRELAKSTRALDQLLPRLQVLARASPMDKRILVAALMARNEVVAVTGDGTNDAPALKNANVGFAMNSGTDVAKKASDVIILDDNFRSIVTAMKWGRNVRDNISKFIQFQMTVNLAAVTIAFIGALFSRDLESPLKPVQLLWLNLIMDTMAALALATELPNDDQLRRQPTGRTAPLITRRMWVNILGQSLYQIIFQLWLLIYGYESLGVEKGSEVHLTIVFNTFVLLQVMNEFNARILDARANILSGLSHAPVFLMIIFVTLFVQYIGICFGGRLFNTVPLTFTQHIMCIKYSFASVVLGKVLRMVPVMTCKQAPLDLILRDEKGMPVLSDAEEEHEYIVAHKKLSFSEATFRVYHGIKEGVSDLRGKNV